MTSTARFELAEQLAEITLGPFEAAELHELWTRGQARGGAEVGAGCCCPPLVGLIADPDRPVADRIAHR